MIEFWSPEGVLLTNSRSSAQSKQFCSIQLDHKFGQKDWTNFINEKIEQAGAELGQAQLKLELGFTSTNLHQIDEQESLIVLC